MGLAAKIYNLIGNGFLTTGIISMVPMFELKGGILFARNQGMGFFDALAAAFIGSTLVFFLVYFLLKPIIALLKKIKWFNKFALAVENYFEKKAKDSLKNKKGGLNADVRLKILAVFVFVALPLPLTGVWTGTAIAVFLGLGFFEAFFAVALGNLVAGTVISVLAELFRPYLDYIIYAFTGLVVISILILILKIIFSKPQKEGLIADKREKE